jgi:uncharacterized repeat protein (TIGR01451 family)
MKYLLLILFFITAPFAAMAQATAYEVPDMNQCGYEIFNLTTQNATALGNQDPENYPVTFYTSEMEAIADANPIANETAYVINSWPSQTIFLKVTNALTSEFDVTSFNIVVAGGPAVGNYNDITVCGSYNLPPIMVGNFYTGPGGTGLQIFAGDIITVTTTLYVYATNGICSSEDSFTVTVIQEPETPLVADVIACASYILPEPPDGYTYQTAPGGGGSQIAPGYVITTSLTIYVYNQFVPCSGGEHFSITIYGNGAPLIITPPEPLIACSAFLDGYATFDLNNALTEFLAGNPDAQNIQFYASEQDAASQVEEIINVSAYINININQETIYISASFGGECNAIVPLQLVASPCGNTTLTGTVTLDADSNGCDAADSPAAGIMVSYSVGSYVYNAYTNANGSYTLTNVPNGTGNLGIQNINGQNLVIPAEVTLNLPGGNVVNDICASVPLPFIDVISYLSSYSGAVPGFTAYYAVTVVNYGTVAASGSVSFIYNNALLNSPVFSGGTQSGSTISWPYTNLAPYQSYTYYVYLTVNTPPTVVSGTALAYTVSASTTDTDVNISNNTQEYTLYAVNSFDPNDITVREGEFITEAQANGFLEYTIRFQNTGSANAQNVRVNLPLDENLDWNTFQPIIASHPYHANREGGVVDFMFDNIQLPFEDANEPGSHGFVTFRIKPVADIQLNDTMSETAYIYFDFNEAIVTNTAITTVGALAIDEFTKASAALYPNPASGVVNLRVKSSLSANAKVMITDVLGKTVLSMPVSAENIAVNISNLVSGVYFVTVQNDNMQSTQKLIIK